MQFITVVNLLLSIPIHAFVQPIALSCRSKQPIGDVKIFSSRAIVENDAPSKQTTVRPLTQNWWPVSLVSALEKNKPNAIELLDKKLVLWYDDSLSR